MELAKVLEYYGYNPLDEKIVCPFHGDVNASLQVTIGQNFWYCYGCGKHGDAMKFHKLYQNALGQNDDLKILKLYNKIIQGDLKNASEIKSVSQTMVKDAAYYRQMLIEAKDFYYGLKSVDWKYEDSEVTDYMFWRGFRKRTLIRFGAKYTYKDLTYPVVFPIKDNGAFKGYVMRTFDKWIESSRKYMYNKGFRRKTTIAGDYRGDVVMIVEGYMDMLKAKQLGVKNVGAILGWKITDQQVNKLLAQNVKVIIAATDNDKCGIKGYEYLKSLKKFKVIRFKFPDNVKDMGDIERVEFKKEKARIEKILKRRDLKWD